MTSWKSRDQLIISPSMAEEEYIVACSASCEAIWLQMLLTDLLDLEMEAIITLNCLGFLVGFILFKP
jgi:hypothetical protein